MPTWLANFDPGNIEPPVKQHPNPQPHLRRPRGFYKKVTAQMTRGYDAPTALAGVDVPL